MDAGMPLHFVVSPAAVAIDGPAAVPGKAGPATRAETDEAARHA